ncbi:MAG: hypothetical protein AAGA48_32940 [Myxococcota bacterium]
MVPNLWLLGMVANAATPQEFLTDCGHAAFAETVKDLDTKARRKQLFELAKQDLEAERFVCSAQLTHLVLSIGGLRKSDERGVVRMLGVVQQLGFDRQARVALYEGRFDDARTLFGHLAGTGHAPSMERVRTWAGFNQRRFLYLRAEDTLDKGRARKAAQLLERLKSNPDRTALTPDLPWTAVDELNEKIEAGIAADDALAKQESADGVSCWTTVTQDAKPNALKVIGGCPEGASERLRDLHRADVEEARQRAMSEPQQVMTEHRG